MSVTPTEKTARYEFKIHGMDCAEEVAVIKREVGPLIGGEDRLSFDILNGKMIVAPLVDITSQQIIAAVSRTGMRAEAWRDTQRDDTETTGWIGWRRATLTTISGVLLAAGILAHGALSGRRAAFGGYEGATMPLLTRLLYLGALVAGIWIVLPKAWIAARRFRPDMNLLMTVAVIGALAIDEWFEAASVAFLFAVSLLLESWSVNRARRAVASLMDLAPPKARVLQTDGSIREVPAEDVSVGTVIVVKPGERIPLDGRVKEGESDVDQAPITGESEPVDKQPGDEVFAGTINGDGALQIESSKPASDTMLAKIIRLVGEAQSRRSPSEQWVEKFARIYTPSVMLLASVVFLVPTLILGGVASDWFYRALVLLVIACPCALVISTPVSVVAGLTSAARQGILIKGGTYLEAPAHLQAIAIDKTGTITSGHLQVVKIVPLSGHDENELIQRAASMEQHSEHPIAKAILNYASVRGVKPAPVVKFQVIKGKGATATFLDREFWLGSHRYLEERGQETDDIHKRLESMSGVGRTVVAVGNDQHVCGLIALADEVRPRVRETLEELREAGIEHLIMLTGDNRPTAEFIGRTAGVDEVRAELLPEDKVAAVELLVQKYKHVAMVGDGVNDAPALARATVGIAMGSAGADAAIETADIALMTDDLSRLPWLIRHSRRTLSIIRQNIGFSLAVKAAFVVLTLVGASSLWAAIAADMGASLVVILNGLRLISAQNSKQVRTTSRTTY